MDRTGPTVGSGANGDLPSERTPLLPSRRPTTGSERVDATEVLNPTHLGTFAARIRFEDISTYNVDSLYPPSLSSRSARAAFSLCVLLYYRKSISGKTSRGRDVWTQWHESVQHSAGVRDLDSLTLRVWTNFLEDDGTGEEIEDVLWSAFPVDVYSASTTVRVIDFLCEGHAPEELSSHPVALSSLQDTWKYGRRISREGDGIVSTFLRFMDGCGTPRVLYIMELTTYLVYLGLLYSFVNRISYPGLVRYAYLLSYPLARLAQPWSRSTVLSLVVLASFLSWFPDVPHFGSIALSWILTALYAELVRIHLPVHNSPLFLFPRELILPLAVLAWRGLRALFVPTAYFLPGLVIYFYLFTQTFEHWGPWSIILPPALGNSFGGPTDTQMTFFWLFSTFFIFMLLTVAYAVVVNPFLAASQGPITTSWDRYTRSVGLQARRAFISVVARYGTDNYFPTPLNIVRFVLVQVSRTLLVVARQRQAAKRLDVVDRALWRVIREANVVVHHLEIMSTRRKSSQRSGPPPAKRRRTDFGAPQADDDIPTAQAQANAPSAAALSERSLPLDHVPPLSAVCIRSFAVNFRKLSIKERVWENVRLWLKELPDPLAQKVFTSLKSTCPTYLSHGLIVSYFLRGTSVVLSDDLPGVSRLTIFAIGDMSTASQLQHLELTGFAKVADTVFASIIAKLPALRRLNLRGCTKVGQKTVESVAKHCPPLEAINLNYTSVTPASFAPLLLQSAELAVLKVAGIPNWLCHALSATDDFQLPNLRSLKCRQTALSDAVLNPILAICPNLERLDLSFTLIKRPVLPAGNMLEKLVLTSTKNSSADLLAMVSPLRRLKVLAIGAMGGGQGSSAAISNTSAMTLTDDTLRSLTDALEACPDLERVSLVGNTKLGFTGRRGPDAALARFVRRVGRRCKHLNLANIASLRSSDLEGLAHPDDPGNGPPQLVHLNLNNTSVDDEAAPYLSACTDLQTLELASTKFTSAGLFPIIDACERLVKLDLTSCRGVRVGDRRRFFEVWEEEWKNT
ncbi:RNI-like protein [Trametes polyzona]|nr:RNI-like protein [Trametes polyzona]